MKADQKVLDYLNKDSVSALAQPVLEIPIR